MSDQKADAADPALLYANLVHLTAEGGLQDLAELEAKLWAQFASGAVLQMHGDGTISQAAEFADRIMREWRKRFLPLPTPEPTVPDMAEAFVAGLPEPTRFDKELAVAREWERPTETVARLTAERDKLLKFKEYVHAYLDRAGVPARPEGVHGAEGCRVGDRLDWLMLRVALPLAEARSAAEGKYGRITAEKKQFHPDEPVFLLRATDPVAPAAVQIYAIVCRLLGCDRGHVEAAFVHSNRLLVWQTLNPNLVKSKPD